MINLNHEKNKVAYFEGEKLKYRIEDLEKVYHAIITDSYTGRYVLNQGVFQYANGDYVSIVIRLADEISSPKLEEWVRERYVKSQKIDEVIHGLKKLEQFYDTLTNLSYNTLENKLY